MLFQEGRPTRFGAYPVGIDTSEVIETAATGTLPAALENLRAAPGPLVVGLERADFTKGIPERLKATTELYERGVVAAYAGIAAPTRPGVISYEGLEGAIERVAGEASRAAARVGATFVQLQQALDWREVVALQRAADVVFTSSLADGMNLVPLQSAVAQFGRPPEQRAIIITGRDTGVAEAFAAFSGRGLNIVDPLNPAAMADTLHRAVTGRLPRVSDELIAAIRARDARAWATSFLEDLEAPSC
jgi:trehalose 6-phosphate synthase